MKFGNALPCVAFVSVLWILASPAYGMTLSEAIEKAKEQSPDRAALTAEREALLARGSQAFAPSQPTFSFGIGDLAGRPGSENSDLRTYQLSQSLGFPGKARVFAHSFDLEAASVNQEIAAKDFEIVRLVKVAFFELWLSEKKIALNDAKASAFEKILSIANRRLVKDTTSEVEFLSAQTAISKIANERSDIVAAERGFRVTFNNRLGLPPETPLKIEAPPVSAELRKTLDATTLRQRFIASNPTLQGLKSRLDAAENRVRESKWAYLPDFRLSAGVNSFNAYAGTVEMSIPLWFWWNEKSGVRAATATRAAEEANYTAKERSMLSAFEEKLIALDTLQSKLKNYRATLVPNSKKAFAVALKNYRFGKIEFATLINAAENLVSSELEYDSMIKEFETARAETEEMLGGTL